MERLEQFDRMSAGQAVGEMAVIANDAIYGAARRAQGVAEVVLQEVTRIPLTITYRVVQALDASVREFLRG